MLVRHGLCGFLEKLRSCGHQDAMCTGHSPARLPVHVFVQVCRSASVSVHENVCVHMCLVCVNALVCAHTCVSVCMYMTVCVPVCGCECMCACGSICLCV